MDSNSDEERRSRRPGPGVDVAFIFLAFVAGFSLIRGSDALRSTAVSSGVVSSGVVRARVDTAPIAPPVATPERSTPTDPTGSTSATDVTLARVLESLPPAQWSRGTAHFEGEVRCEGIPIAGLELIACVEGLAPEIVTAGEFLSLSRESGALNADRLRHQALQQRFEATLRSSAVTDDRGRFRIEGIDPERRYRLEVASDGYAVAHASPYVGMPMSLQAFPALLQEFNVLLPDGASAAEAWIEFESLEGDTSSEETPSSLPRIHYWSATHRQLFCPRGRYRVHAQHHPWQSQRVELTFSPTVATEAIELKLNPNDTITLRLHTTSPRLLHGARFVGLDGNSMPPWARSDLLVAVPAIREYVLGVGLGSALLGNEMGVLGGAEELLAQIQAPDPLNGATVQVDLALEVETITVRARRTTGEGVELAGGWLDDDFIHPYNIREIVVGHYEIDCNRFAENTPNAERETVSLSLITTEGDRVEHELSLARPLVADLEVPEMARLLLRVTNFVGHPWRHKELHVRSGKGSEVRVDTSRGEGVCRVPFGEFEICTDAGLPLHSGFAESPALTVDVQFPELVRVSVRSAGRPLPDTIGSRDGWQWSAMRSAGRGVTGFDPDSEATAEFLVPRGDYSLYGDRSQFMPLLVTRDCEVSHVPRSSDAFVMGRALWGLERGDVLIAVAGRRIESFLHLQGLWSLASRRGSKGAPSSLSCRVWRHGQELEVLLKDAPEEVAAFNGILIPTAMRRD